MGEEELTRGFGSDVCDELMYFRWAGCLRKVFGSVVELLICMLDRKRSDIQVSSEIT